jgi:hypothetical protein
MAIRDEATRRQIQAEFERGFSPLRVQTRWQDFGNFVFQIEGLEAVRIPTAKVSWNEVVNTITFHRRELLRGGAQLDPWEPPLHHPH